MHEILRFAQNDNYLVGLTVRRGRLAAMPPTAPSFKTQLPVILSETKWSEESHDYFTYNPFSSDYFL